MNERVAAFIVNYNMPERADALAAHINNHIDYPVDVYLIDNGSDQVSPAEHTNVFLPDNCQTTAGWLAGLEKADRSGHSYLAYWFLITSTAFVGQGDTLSPMACLLLRDSEAVGVHPALTPDSTTAWGHLHSRGEMFPRRTWMIDNIASLYRADWFDEIGRFDPEMKYAWGIDLETSWKARSQGRSLWIDERVQVEKKTDIGYTMGRMGIDADTRRKLAAQNMTEVLSRRYGWQWRHRMTKENVRAKWL